MLFGFGTNLYLWLGTKVAWTWYVAIGATITFAIGYAASVFFEQSASEHPSESQ